MASFIKGIEAKERVVEFSFTAVYTVNDMRYYVSVVDSELKPYLFHMEQRNNDWLIIDAPEVPGWIHKLINQLNQAIYEQATQ